MSAIEGIGPTDSNLICFDLENHVPRLPHQIAFLILVIINEKTIHQTVIDEGAPTYIMSTACWKAIGSLASNQSLNTLEAFDGHDSQPFDILPNLAITLEGKTMQVKVEIVDTNLNYNLLLSQSWTHAMHAVASSLFRVIFFPHQGKIVTVDQLSFFSYSSLDGNVPYVKHTGAPYESVGTGLFKYYALMGISPLPPPHVAFVNMILVKSDPWVIPSLDLVDTWGEVMPLNPTEVNYMEIVSTLNSASSNSFMSKTSFDTYSQSLWLGTLESLDPLAKTFLADEGIMEVTSLKEPPWINTHHHSSFLPHPAVMSTTFEESSSPLSIYMSIYPNIINIFKLRAPLSHHGFNIFHHPRVFTNFPSLQWGFHLIRNPPSPRGHGGKALYAFYSIIWPSRCLLVMTTVKLWCPSVLIDYPNPSMDSLKKYYA